MAAAVAVTENPFAGTFVGALTPLVDAGEELGALLAKKATEALGAPAESYGKAAVVGEAGEYEHAAALLHPKLGAPLRARSEEHTSELQSRLHLVCRLLLEKKKKRKTSPILRTID